MLVDRIKTQGAREVAFAAPSENLFQVPSTVAHNQVGQSVPRGSKPSSGPQPSEPGIHLRAHCVDQAGLNLPNSCLSNPGAKGVLLYTQPEGREISRWVLVEIKGLPDLVPESPGGSFTLEAGCRLIHRSHALP